MLQLKLDKCKAQIQYLKKFLQQLQIKPEYELQAPTEVYIWEHLPANIQTADLKQKQKLLQKINSIHPIIFF